MEIERILVIGAGGVGFWTAVPLAASSLPLRISVVDDDIAEGSGLERLPASIARRPKVNGLRRTVRTLDRTTVEIFNERCEEETWKEKIHEFDAIIDGTDLSRDKRWWFNEHPRCLRCSYDGDTGFVIVHDRPPSAFFVGDQAPEGYREKPSRALAQAAGGIVAAMVERAVSTYSGGDLWSSLSLPKTIELWEEG